MKKNVSADSPSKDLQKSIDSKSSEISESGSRIIINTRNKKYLVYSEKDYVRLQRNVPKSISFDERKSPQSDNSFVLSSVQNVPASSRELGQGLEFFERGPVRLSSTPNLMYNVTPKIHINGAPRHRSRCPSITEFKSQSENEFQIPIDESDDLFPLETGGDMQNGANCRIRHNKFSGLLSFLSSIINPRSLECLDENVLNNFNMEVGIVTSRVDMWRQKLEDERSNSVQSHTRSLESIRPYRSTNDQDDYAFILSEIQYLVQLTTSLTNSVFGRLPGRLFGIEDKLMSLLQNGSNMVFPAVEIIIMNLWGMLKDFFYINCEDTEKSGGLHSVVETINNAIYAIRSLIHIGYAYRNGREPSDSVYTGGSMLARSIAHFESQEKEKEQKSD